MTVNNKLVIIILFIFILFPVYSGGQFEPINPVYVENHRIIHVHDETPLGYDNWDWQVFIPGQYCAYTYGNTTYIKLSSIPFKVRAERDSGRKKYNLTLSCDEIGYEYSVSKEHDYGVFYYDYSSNANMRIANNNLYKVTLKGYDRHWFHWDRVVTKTVYVRRDINSPTLSIVPRYAANDIQISDLTGWVNADYGGAYLDITTSDNFPVGSGVKNVRVHLCDAEKVNNDWTFDDIYDRVRSYSANYYGGNFTYNFNQDGVFKYAVQSIDNVYNAKLDGRIIIKIDTTPPDFPGDIQLNINEDDLTLENSIITMLWEVATDTTSGFQKYQYQLSGGNLIEVFGVEENDRKYLPLLDRGLEYSFQVDAVDVAQNESSKILNDIYIPLPVDLDIRFNEPYVENNIVIYPMVIGIDGEAVNVNNYQGFYVVSDNTHTDYNNSQFIFKEITNDARYITPDELINNEYIFNFEGIEFAHQPQFYQLYSQFLPFLNNIIEERNIRETVVRNYLPPFDIEVYGDDDYLVNESADVFLISNGEQVNTIFGSDDQNGIIQFKMIPDPVGIMPEDINKDIEGDDISFSLYTRNGTEITTETLSEPIILSSTYDQHIKAYIEVGNRNETSNIYDYKFIPFNFSNEDNLLDIRFQISNPFGDFNVYNYNTFGSYDEDQKLHLDNPARTSQVDIVIKKSDLKLENELCPFEGLLEDNVSIDFTFYDITQMPYPEDVVAIDFIKDDLNSISEWINLDSIMFTEDIDNIYARIEIPPELHSNEYTSIVMRIEYTGSEKKVYILKKFLLAIDGSAAQIDDFDYNIGYTIDTNGDQQNSITLTWIPPEQIIPLDIDKYYVIINNELADIVEATTEDTIFSTIDVTSFGYNMPVTVGVITEDERGFQSLPFEKIIYTPPEIGTLIKTDSGYMDGTEENPGHFISFEAQSGNASYFQIKLTDTVNALSVISDSFETNCSMYGLNAHGNYYGELIVYNEDDKFIISDTEQIFQVDNQIPYVPTEQILTNYYFSKSIVRFDWTPFIDNDSDTLKHTIVCEDTIGNEIIRFEDVYTTVYEISGTLTDVFDTYHDQTINWYVIAEDSFGGSNLSVEGSFVYDALPPGFIFNNPPNLFISDEEWEIEVSEAGSGIKIIEYSTSDGQINNIDISENSIDKDLLGNGTYTFNLPESNTGIGYLISFSIMDIAGNTTNYETNYFKIDHTEPIVSLIEVGDTLGTVYSYGILPVSIILSDNLSGIKGFYYEIDNDDVFEIANSEYYQLEVDEEILGPKEYNINLNYSGEVEAEYSLQIKVEDFAGELSDVTSFEQAIYFDTSAPVVNFNVNSITKSNYIESFDDLNLMFSSEDDESGIAFTELAICLNGDQPFWNDENTDWETVKSQITPFNGDTYTIFARVVNYAGLETVLFSSPYHIDNTGPENITYSIEPSSDNLMSEEAVNIHVSAIDNESDIIELAIAIGTAPGLNDISQNINGNVDGWLILKNQMEADFSFNLPVLLDGYYFISVRAINSSQIESIYSPDLEYLTINNNQERIIVYDEGMYHADDTILNASWNYSGSEIITGYRYRIVDSDNIIITDWQETANTDEIITGLLLTNGTMYYIEVEGKNSSELFVVSGKSDGIIIDTTAPVINNISAPDACTSANLWFAWDAEDPESNIKTVEVIVEKQNPLNMTVFDDITGGELGFPVKKDQNIYIGYDNNGDIIQLDTDDKIRLRIRISNQAGGLVETTTSLITIDNSPPPIPYVLDQGRAIQPVQDPQADWFWTLPDPQSDTVRYEWTAVNDINSMDTALWIDANVNTSCLLSEASYIDFNTFKTHGKICYFVVKAINGSGLESIGFSNGITFDTTAPFIGNIKLLQLRGTEEYEVRYINSAENLRAHIDVTEDIAQSINRYSIVPGFLNEYMEWEQIVDSLTYESIITNPEDIYASPYIDLPGDVELLGNGAINVFEGSAENEAGLQGIGYSFGVVSDVDIPEITSFIAWITNNDLYLQWEALVKQSPIEYFILTLENVNTSMSTTINVSENNYIIEDLEPGIYSASVIAKSVSGNYSNSYYLADEIIFDVTPPEILDSIYTDKYVSFNLSFSAEAYDPESGINEYEYSLGTDSSPFLFSDGNEWRSVSSNEGFISGIIDFESDLLGGVVSVVDVSEIYLSVRARNNCGLWSSTLKSQVIYVDKTPAIIESITATGYTTSNNHLDNIMFNLNDMQSCIKAFRLGVIESGFSDYDPEDWQLFEIDNVSEIKEFNSSAYFPDGIPLNPLNLIHSSEYIVGIQVQNGSEDWSDIIFSNIVKADFVKPELIFPNPEGEVIVNNTPHFIEYEIVEDVSENVETIFTLVHPDGSITVSEPFLHEPGVYSYEFIYPEYGNYFLYAQLTDTAGNIVTRTDTQHIRVNRLPEVGLKDSETNPGKPTDLFEQSVWLVRDLDNDTPLTYYWEITAQSGYAGYSSTLESPIVELYQLPDYTSQTTNYTVSLTVTDSAGGSTTETCILAVVNTSAGTLYTDEYWSGDHTITGDIIIPSGIELVIAENTNVTITGNSIDGFDWNITVYGGLETMAGAIIRMMEDRSEYWQGIYIYGDLKMNSSTVKDAARGIVLMPETIGNTIIITGNTFEDNIIGLHILGTEHEINNCIFRNNSRYGIKEDENGNPVVRNCIFELNLYDYYDEAKRIISMQDVNDEVGNENNISDKD